MYELELELEQSHTLGGGAARVPVMSTVGKLAKSASGSVVGLGVVRPRDPNREI